MCGVCGVHVWCVCVVCMCGVCGVCVWCVCVFAIVCAARVVFEGDLMQDFLNLRKPGGTSGAGVSAGAAKKEESKKEEEVMMNIQVILADKRVVTVAVREHWKTRDVYQVRRGVWVCACLSVWCGIWVRSRQKFA